MSRTHTRPPGRAARQRDSSAPSGDRSLTRQVPRSPGPPSRSVRWALETLSGDLLLVGEAPVEAPPLGAVLVQTVNCADQVSDANRREVVFIAELRQGAQMVARQVVPFVPTKHLDLTDPAITAMLRREGDQAVVDVAARSLARLVEVSLAGADVVFSDNYFDLPAGRLATVAAPWPAGWTLDQARAALSIRSVYDSYAHPAPARPRPGD